MQNTKNKLIRVNPNAPELPSLLWAVSFLHSIALSAFVLTVYNGSYVVPLSFSWLATTFFFHRHKASWTIAMSWLLISLAVVFKDILPLFILGGMSQTQVLNFGAYLVLTLGTMILSMLYFKYPYINVRTSLVGGGLRIPTNLKASAHKDGKAFDGVVKDISMSGALMIFLEMNEEQKSLFKEKSSFEVRIPEINNFISKVRIARVTGNSVAVEFLGWSWRSLIEHMKVFRWIDKKKSAGKEVKEAKENNEASMKVVSQNGFTILEALIVCGLSSFIIFIASDTFLQLDKSRKHSQMKMQIEFLKDDISRTLRDSTAWRNTINAQANSPLLCMKNKTACVFPMNDNVVDIYDIQNELALNSRSATAGFNWDGAPCDQFDAIQGNDACPLKAVARIYSPCAGTCLNPTIEVRMEFTFKPQSPMFSINMEKLALRVFKDPIEDTLADNCTSLKGRFDTNTGTCEIEAFNGRCAGGTQYMSGLNGKTPICQRLVAQVLCAPGLWLRGFDQDTGAAICTAN